MKKQLIGLLTIATFAVGFTSCSIFKKSHSSAGSFTDPVCKMKVEKSSAFTVKYKGETYYFDSYNCKETFKMNPGNFVDSTGNKPK